MYFRSGGGERLNGVRIVAHHRPTAIPCSVDSHHRLFLFVSQSGHHVIIKQDGWAFLMRPRPHTVHTLPVLLEVPTAVETGRAEVTGERPLSGVNDDMSGELRTALLVFATDVADKALRQALSVSVDDLTVSLQVAEASEAAAAEVAVVWPHLAVGQRVAGQQRLEFENFSTDWTRKLLRRRRALPASDGVWRLVDSDPEVNPYMVLLQAGGTLEATQTDAAAVRFVA